ncbi:MAG TPA: rRNA maturation RNase YbeY [Bacteroidia bacterium]|nr:rRNA maturation RNase YbeY [Bacteroidia bacterium]
MPSPSLSFHNVDIRFKIKQQKKIKNWLMNVASAEKKNIDTLNYIFCSDAYLLKINREYLQHETLTDIITFDYSEKKNISGDIFISVERVTENAEKYNVTFENELLRVMVHGVLHLIGFNDKTISEKETMRAKENFYLELY